MSGGLSRKTIEIAEEIGTDHPGTRCLAPLVTRWEEIAKETGDLPSSDHFMMDSLGEFAGRLSVVEPVGADDFRYVIYAGAVANVGGVDMGDRRVSDFPYADLRAWFRTVYRRVMEERRPKICRLRHDWRGTVYDYCTLNLPVLRASTGKVRIHTVLVNTDPARRKLYQSQFVTGQSLETPEDIRPDQGPGMTFPA